MKYLWTMDRVCIEILQKFRSVSVKHFTKFRIILEVSEADDFANFGRHIFQNFKLDLAEIIDNL